MAAKPALRLDVFVAFPSYGGNGGVASEHPDIREWWAQLYAKMCVDPRIGQVITRTYNDTPITMIRNRMVVDARRAGCHLLLMVDSDMSPDCNAHDPTAEPFWDAAFNAIYEHYGKGPLVVGAPYGGPPDSGENCYVFFWEHDGQRGKETPMRLSQYPRAIAAKMTGVQEVAALPTGLILYDMRAFQLIEPLNVDGDEVLERFRVGEVDATTVLRTLQGGWFRYEWTDAYASQKASTEDVQNTRDISMAGFVRLGYNPVRCAWDSWAGHWKPWCVRKPQGFSVEQVAASFRHAVETDNRRRERILNFQSNLEEEETKNTKLVVETTTWDQAHRMPADHVTAVANVVRRQYDAMVDGKDFSTGDLVYYLEVGVWLGSTFKEIAGLPFVDAWAVDTFEGSPSDHTGDLATLVGPKEVREEFQKRMGDLPYKLFQEPFQTFATPYRFDVIFVDAAHDEESATRDIAKAISLLTTRGVLLIHDYLTHQFPGVTAAADKLLGDELRIVWNDRHGAIALYAKTSGDAPWNQLPKATDVKRASVPTVNSSSP